MRGVRKEGPTRIGDLVTQVMKTAVGPQRRRMAELSLVWSRVVGPEVARRSHPVALRGASLVVSFDSSALRQEVECFRKAEILEKLGAEYTARRIVTLKCVLSG